MPRFLHPALLLCGCALGLAPLTATPTPSPWLHASRLQFNAAYDAFAAAPPSRANRLGLATALLNRQPQVPGDLAKATALCASLRAESTTDDIAVTALYLLARIAQLHASPADPVRAATLFRELAEHHPAHPLAQLSLIKLALLRLYEPIPRPELPARFAEVEAFAPHIFDAALRFQFHQVLREAYGRLLGDFAAELRHAEFQLALPAPRPGRRADVIIHAAECCRRLGRPADAVRHFDLFLAEFPFESRAGEVAAVRAELLAAP